jgi:uncharacterized membrane protein YhhN
MKVSAATWTKSEKMRRVFLLLFALVSAGEILSNITNYDLLHTICKPGIILTLLGYYLFAMRSSGNSVSKPVLLALLFSWSGDVLLMRTGELFFILGLVAFLIAHVFYIMAYRQHRSDDDTQSLHGLQRLRFAFPILLSGTGLFVILYPRLNELRIPVFVYAVVLTWMVLQALFRFGRTSSPSFALVFGGAILFMISDSLLAVNKFLEPVTNSGLWIMLTYISAQFLIVLGLVRHRN